MTIPKPLVQINQMFIVITVFLSLTFFKPLLVLPLIIGLITISTKKNPIIIGSKGFLTKAPSAYIQEDRDQQLFNQWIATICLLLSCISFGIGWTIFGYIFAILVIVAAGIALMGFCVGCFIRFQYQQWHYRRKQHKLTQ